MKPGSFVRLKSPDEIYWHSFDDVVSWLDGGVDNFKYFDDAHILEKPTRLGLINARRFIKRSHVYSVLFETALVWVLAFSVKVVKVN